MIEEKIMPKSTTVVVSKPESPAWRIVSRMAIRAMRRDWRSGELRM